VQRSLLMALVAVLLLAGSLSATEFKSARVKSKKMTFWGYELVLAAGSKEYTVQALIRRTRAFNADGREVKFMTAAKEIFPVGARVQVSTSKIDGKQVGKQGEVEYASRIKQLKTKR